jgi:hypothetical protein
MARNINIKRTLIMTKRKKFILFFISSFLWAFIPSHVQLAQGPKMVIVEKHYNFNRVMEGEIVEHTFRVLNKGDQPLEIKEVKPG